MSTIRTVALLALAAGAPHIAYAQVPEAERAAFIKGDIANCVALQQYSLPRKSIPAPQYKAFCECRAAYLVKNTTPADYMKFKEQSIPMRQSASANNTCEKQVFGRQL